MKRMILAALAVVGISALCGLALQMKRNREQSVVEINPGLATDSISNLSGEAVQPDGPAMSARRLPSERLVNARDRSSNPGASAQSAVHPSTPADPGRASQITLNQAIESIVSPRSSHAQKEAAWKQLRESGKLDQAIADLEQRAASNVGMAEYPAALGQAHLQKCGTIQDVREQGILAMKADQVFDAALNLDANNWEARFTKAFAMSFWPTQMNQGNEGMQHFVTLIEQQESQTPQRGEHLLVLPGRPQRRTADTARNGHRYTAGLGRRGEPSLPRDVCIPPPRDSRRPNVPDSAWRQDHHRGAKPGCRQHRSAGRVGLLNLQCPDRATGLLRNPRRREHVSGQPLLRVEVSFQQRRFFRLPDRGPASGTEGAGRSGNLAAAGVCAIKHHQSSRRVFDPRPGNPARSNVHHSTGRHRDEWRTGNRRGQPRIARRARFLNVRRQCRPESQNS